MMINIDKIKDNTIYLTLSADCILSGLTSAYTLSLKYQETDTTTSISMNDVSTNNLYNMFIINISATTLTNGIYDYFIYNSVYPNIELEIGKCYIVSSNTSDAYKIDTRQVIKKRVDSRR